MLISNLQKEIILQSHLNEVFGIDGFEAKIYLGLLKFGPTTASNLAKNLDIDRAKTYRTTEVLIKKGFVSTTMSSPKKCLAEDPEKIISEICTKKENEIVKLKTKSKKLINQIKESYESQPQHTNLKTIQNREEIFAQISNILEKATNTVYIVTTVEDIAKMYYSTIPEKVRLCEKNGVQVRIITETNDSSDLEYINRLCPGDIRTVTLDTHQRIVVEKNNFAISSLIQTRTPKLETAIITNFESIVQTNYQFCEMLWSKAKPIEKIRIKNS